MENGINNINTLIDTYAGVSDKGYSKREDYDKASTGMTDVENLIGYKYSPDAERGYKASTTMENFEEYLKDKQDKLKETGEDEASKKQEEKEALKEISQRISSEELKQLQMMGIDVESASLSDIMGMVNTIRYKADSEQTRQMMAEIMSDNMDANELTISGSSVKIAGTDIELKNVDVREVVEETEGSLKVDAGVEEFLVSDSELIYMLRNNLSISKENIKKAHYSGVKVSKEMIPEKALMEMMPQINKVIEQAGFEVTDATSVKGAKLLINNQIPLTTDTLRKYVEFQEYVGKDVNLIKPVEISNDAVAEKAKQLLHDVNAIPLDTVYEMAEQDKNITIASVLNYIKQNNNNKNAYDALPRKDYSNTESKAVKAMRQMEEIRLSMTLDAATRLVKSDFNIDTRELSRVVNQLREIEDALIKTSLKNEGVQPTPENVQIYKELNEKVQSIGEAPASIVATPVKNGGFTVELLYQETIALNDDASYENVNTQKPSYEKFETVRRSYEAIWTAPRADMGDSIKKAFVNVGDILKDLEMPVNYETERAVRILGYNQMEINKENIDQIIHYDRQVNELVNTFYPEAVMGMIKDGINPLEVSIEELNQIIRERNYNAGVTEAENFATFLRDMEKKGDVTAEERESYIGIYRMLDKLSKSGDREAGWIFANKSRLTVKNLVHAMRSRRATGLDVSVDESFGMLESAELKGKDMLEQISAAFSQMDENVDEFMAEHQIQYTMVNQAAVGVMLNNNGGIYQMVSDILSKMKFVSNTKEEMVDEETENMTDSMSGDEIPVEFLPESILESLKGREEMSLKYEDLRNRLTEMFYQAGMVGTITSIDMSAIKTVNAGFNILSGMAKQDKYQLPVETEQGIKIVNLTVLHNQEQKGNIEIDIHGEIMGDVKANISLFEDGSLKGYVVASTSQGNYELMERSGNLLESLKNSGLSGDNLKIGSMDNEITSGTDVPEKIYDACVFLVKAIGNVVR